MGDHGGDAVNQERYVGGLTALAVDAQLDSPMIGMADLGRRRDVAEHR